MSISRRIILALVAVVSIVLTMAAATMESSQAAPAPTITTDLGHMDGLDDAYGVRTEAGHQTTLIRYTDYRLRLYKMVGDTPAAHQAVAGAVGLVTASTERPTIVCKRAVYSLAQVWAGSPVRDISTFETYRYVKWAERYAERHDCSTLTTFSKCKTEDSSNCVWDASRQGSHGGQSFLSDSRGNVYPITTEQAAHLRSEIRQSRG